jgi:hypothetical protein
VDDGSNGKVNKSFCGRQTAKILHGAMSEDLQKEKENQNGGK